VPGEGSSIAIIAMVGRFPGAENIEEYWRNLRAGVESLSRPAPSESLDAEPNYVMAYGALRDVECFDHQYFDYSPAEAELIDPQQRLFLQQASAALEEAGYNPDIYPGLIGVFAGISTNTYQYNNILARDRKPDSTRLFHIMVANDKDYLSTRISYKINLKGPSYTIQTACSTSLVAIHAACQSLLTGECDMALAGGVTVRVPQVSGYLYEEGMVYSKDGRVRSFDAAASGTVIGNGLGIVVLKPLAAALRDRDTIHAVIKGSATNNDGSFKASYAAPSREGQARVILEAQSLAGVEADSITYVEAHATGTLLGDPVEVSALTQAFRKRTAATGFCALGSVKSNVGHLDSAAGVAGLIKTVLMLKNRELVPTVHFTALNPNIDLQGSPFYISERLAPWPRSAKPLRAAVSSFGVGGTNAHVILEEAPPQPPSDPSAGPQLLLLSAKTPAALERLGESLEEFLRAESEINLADVAYTLSVGRRSFRYRRAMIHSELDLSREAPTNAARVVVIFPSSMPAERIFQHATRQPRYRALIERRTAQLAEHLGIKPFDALAAQASPRDERLATLVAVLSLADFFEGLGVSPDAVSGRGLGELAAAVAAGALSFKQALQIIDAPQQWPGISNPKLTRDALVENAEQILLDLGSEDSIAVSLAKLWTRGVAVDWTAYYAHEKRKRIRLPTYPFAKHRHWIEPPIATISHSNCVLHPLVHRNVSTFERVRFEARFSGDEFFLKDHVVAGRKVLPGVAYLEMVRAAVELANTRSLGAAESWVLKNVVWMSPLAIERSDREISIELERSATGAMQYTVKSCAGERDAEQVHSQGLIELRELHPPTSLDLSGLRASLNGKVIESQPFYDWFDARGLKYGSTHRGVRRIYVGQSQALARISLPDDAGNSSTQFCLHPSVMDGALQVTAAWDWGERSDSVSQDYALPFELGELEVYGRCEKAVYVWVRECEGTESARRRQFDIDLCDEQGNVCVRMKGFSTRVAKSVVALANLRMDPAHRYVPVWNPASKPERSGFNPKAIVVGSRPLQRLSSLDYVPLEADESIASIARKLSAQAFEHLVWIAPDVEATSIEDERLLADQRRGVVQLFRTTKALLSLGYGSRNLELTLITRNALPVLRDDRVDPSHAGVHGFAGSLAKEYEHWIVRALDMPADGAWPLEDLLEGGARASGSLAYRNREWLSQELVRVQSLPSGPADYQAGGVYVIVGGAGGLGAVLSRYLAERYLARVVWIGRRPLDDAIRAKIASFPSSMPAPSYVSADATDRSSLAAACSHIKQQFGAINGVIHSAIVLSDKSLANMDEQELLASLSAKVDVSLRIAQVFASEALDFVLFFSSIQSFSRSPGQSNYAAGCVFKDAFAQRLRQEWPCAVKTINWGFWGAAGVVVSAEYRERMARAGIGSIEPEEGMATLTEFLSSSLSQLVLYKGSRTDVLNAVSEDDWFTAYPTDAPSIIDVLRRTG
jgi:polyketide synthase PksM